MRFSCLLFASVACEKAAGRAGWPAAISRRAESGRDLDAGYHGALNRRADPVRAEQGDGLAPGDLEADVIERGDPAVVDLHHVAEGDGGARVSACCPHDSHARCAPGPAHVPRITNPA